LLWFQKNARPLPWRDNRDPYRIWISEVMLQQTQVATVIPYFERFVQQFPTLAHLARADEPTILRLWEGLGYYRRARDLLRAAQLLNEMNYATIPDDPDVVQSLPGFGLYTTNAVLSQAYDRRLPILEANSIRVLCRLFGIDGNPKESAVQKHLWKLAESLLPARQAGNYNQALMELGALLCAPTKPDCGRCPLKSGCHANEHQRQADLPRRADKPNVVTVAEVAVVVRKKHRVLLVQRLGKGRWANMWEFPHHPCAAAESTESAAQRLLALLGIQGELAETIATIRHNVTRFRIHMTTILVEYGAGKFTSCNHQGAAWVNIEELHAYPLSTPQRRLAQLLVEKAGKRAKVVKTA
jgi:A/G-specific adenine glycosylase